MAKDRSALKKGSSQPLSARRTTSLPLARSGRLELFVFSICDRGPVCLFGMDSTTIVIVQTGNAGYATRLDGIAFGGNDMMMLDGRVCIGFFSFSVLVGFSRDDGGSKGERGMGNGEWGGRQGAVRCHCKIPIGGLLQSLRIESLSSS